MHKLLQVRRETVQRERWEELQINVLQALRNLNEFDEKSRTPAWLNLASALIKLMAETGEAFSEERLLNVMRMVNSLPPTVAALVDELPAKLETIIAAAEKLPPKALTSQNQVSHRGLEIAR
jgi:hypothetical protein